MRQLVANPPAKVSRNTQVICLAVGYHTKSLWSKTIRQTMTIKVFETFLNRIGLVSVRTNAQAEGITFEVAKF